MDYKSYLTKNKFTISFVTTGILLLFVLVELIAYSIMFSLGYRDGIPWIYYGLPSIWLAAIALIACLAEVVAVILLKKRHCLSDYIMWIIIAGIFIYLVAEGLALFSSSGPVDDREVTRYYGFCFLREGNIGGNVSFDDIKYVSRWSVCIQTIVSPILFAAYTTLWLIEQKKMRYLAVNIEKNQEK